MVPGRERRRTKVERGAMRLIATGGIIGIAVVLGAILVGQDVAGWIVGLVVGLTSVILAALLWSSRQLQPSLTPGPRRRPAIGHSNAIRRTLIGMGRPANRW
jgi:uncharacterized membrane protein